MLPQELPQRRPGDSSVILLGEDFTAQLTNILQSLQLIPVHPPWNDYRQKVDRYCQSRNYPGPTGRMVPYHRNNAVGYLVQLTYTYSRIGQLIDGPIPRHAYEGDSVILLK